MLSSQQTDRELAIAYYYCDYADKRTLNPVNIFGCVAQQLLLKMGVGGLPSPISALIEDYFQDGSRRASTSEVLEILLLTISNFPAVAILIDGLDEVGEHDQKILEMGLKDLINQTHSCTVKFLLCSREDASSTYALEFREISRIQISASCIAADIESYIKCTVRDLLKSGEMVLQDTSLEDETVSALIEGAKGM
jgi:hypothetical protein